MPQIMCPNCGRTITLENRRKTDFDLILNAVRKEPKNFTDLLRVTRLSRKTLSLRLKDMCGSGMLVKREGKYILNGVPQFLSTAGNHLERFLRMFQNRRMKMGLMLISLMVLSSASGYGFATFLGNPQATQVEPGRMISGKFIMALDINEVQDLYGWQVVIAYNPTELEVFEVIPGDFLRSEFFANDTAEVKRSLLVNNTRTGEGTLLLGGCLIGPVPGINGSGRLAIITFAYYTATYEEPKLVSAASVFDTVLLNSHLSDIPIANSTLTLYVTGKQ